MNVEVWEGFADIEELNRSRKRARRVRLPRRTEWWRSSNGAGGRVSSVACGEPLSLTHIPSGRVVRLAGPTEEQLAVSLDPLPVGAPVVLRCRIPPALSTPHEVVDDVLGRLESVAVDLFPAWLPDAEAIATSSDFDRRVVRELAHRAAADTEHFGPFLAELAEAALRGRAPDRRFAPEVRARGLARIIAESYARQGVVLLVGPFEGSPSEHAQRRVTVACEWLADHGGIGVWLTDGVLPLVDRYPTWQLSLPDFVDAMAADVSLEAGPPLDYPALLGRPHPASVAEQTLERSLARCEWASGRVWNQLHASHSLAPPIRVDLMWPDERCVVEIDGPDHRGSLKYAADRRRDNGLTLDGYAVLRFTNDEIGDDPERVLAVIERLLVTKRHDEGNLA
jgi:very-short-patch-repair endonuclease